LIVAGGALGAGLLAFGGLVTFCNQAPPVHRVSASCGKERNMTKVLVTYASKNGSTGEVAQAIADELCRRGGAADVWRVEDVAARDLPAYGAVIIGSAIRMGSWLPQATRFVEQNRDALSRLPVAYFAVHLLNRDDSKESRQKRCACLDPVRRLLAPQYEGFFAGKIEMRRLTLVDRLMAKAAKAVDGDYRDWAAIRGWAGQIAQQEGMPA
jgi:menaquinone-dependent protoporphyrinogen oxidase